MLDVMCLKHEIQFFMVVSNLQAVKSYTCGRKALVGNGDECRGGGGVGGWGGEVLTQFCN